MARVFVIVVAAGGIAACAVEPTQPVPALDAITFNVHGSDTIQDPILGPAIAAELMEFDPDVLSLQECVSCQSLLDLMPARYDLVPNQDSAVQVMYDATLWSLEDHGTIVLGANDDGWGRREVVWGRLSLLETGADLFVYSTHWCVSIRNPDDPCDVDKHLEYGQAIVDHVSSHGSPSVVGGDFNVFDGFEDGPAVEFLEANGLVDTLRQITSEPVVTYQGNNSFPPGRIDYVFATTPVDVLAASVALDSVSDHRVVSATVAFPAGTSR